MTVSTSKTMLLAGINRSIAGLAAPAHAPLNVYLVVPDTVFNSFGAVTIRDGGAAANWPARLPAGRRFVLAIPMLRGKKRTRQDAEQEARDKLEEQGLAPDPVIQELLTPNRTDAELASLREHGLIMMQQAPQRRSRVHLGDLPAAAPTHRVYRRTLQGVFTVVALTPVPAAAP
jgi:hypothetical protein